MLSFDAVTKEPHEILVPHSTYRFDLDFELFLSLPSVVEKILYSDYRFILEDASVHDPVPSLSDHVLVGESIGGNLELS
ncbi:hypothetical protein YC2023_104936 [Brassica napus]